MKHSVEIKKLNYFYPNKNAKIVLQGLLTSHMDEKDINKILNSNKVQPISVINIIPKHKRTIVCYNYGKYSIQEIPNTYFVCNMLKINNKLHFTSFNGGLLLGSNSIGCLDNSMTYSFCLSNIIKLNCTCKNNNDILLYNNYILSTFWQTNFDYILNDKGYNKKYNICISKLFFRIINKNPMSFLTDEPSYASF